MNGINYDTYNPLKSVNMPPMCGERLYMIGLSPRPSHPKGGKEKQSLVKLVQTKK